MSFGIIPLSPDDKPDGFVLLSTYEKLESENAKLRELLLDYDKMLASAANELGYQSRGVRMDSVLNALRIRMSELGIEV